jgi:hypothetical protein
MAGRGTFRMHTLPSREQCGKQINMGDSLTYVLLLYWQTELHVNQRNTLITNKLKPHTKKCLPCSRHGLNSSKLNPINIKAIKLNSSK